MYALLKGCLFCSVPTPPRQKYSQQHPAKEARSKEQSAKQYGGEKYREREPVCQWRSLDPWELAMLLADSS